MNRLRANLELTPDESGKGTRLYTIWRGLRQRCGLYAGGHEHDLKRYKERGITCCAAWAGAFKPFHDWAVTHGYEATLYLDRRNNDGPYSPENCRWVTVTASNQNKSSVLTAQETNKVLIMLMVGCSIQDTAKAVDISDTTIYNMRKKYFAHRWSV